MATRTPAGDADTLKAVSEAMGGAAALLSAGKAGEAKEIFTALSNANILKTGSALQVAFYAALVNAGVGAAEKADKAVETYRTAERFPVGDERQAEGFKSAMKLLMQAHDALNAFSAHLQLSQPLQRQGKGNAPITGWLFPLWAGAAYRIATHYESKWFDKLVGMGCNLRYEPETGSLAFAEKQNCIPEHERVGEALELAYTAALWRVAERHIHAAAFIEGYAALELDDSRSKKLTIDTLLGSANAAKAASMHESAKRCKSMSERIEGPSELEMLVDFYRGYWPLAKAREILAAAHAPEKAAAAYNETCRLSQDAQYHLINARLKGEELLLFFKGLNADGDKHAGNGDSLRQIFAVAEATIENFFHFANRQLAETHVVQARANYNIGTANYNQQTGILGDAERKALETAAEKYRQANNAFAEFEGSFKAPQALNEKQQWLAQVFPFWADASLKLAADSHQRGNQLLSEAMANSQGRLDKDGIIHGLKALDKAVGFYRAAMEIHDEAAAKGVQIDGGFKTVPQQRIAETVKAAGAWANAIGNPALKMHYPKL